MVYSLKNKASKIIVQFIWFVVLETVKNKFFPAPNFMIEALRNYFIDKKVKLTQEELSYWLSLFIPRKIKRNEFLQREGEVSKHAAFVVKGCLRLYTVDAKGKEHIMQFAPENWWVGDADSSTKNIPSLYFIDAIEDSEVLLIETQSMDAAFKKIPAIAIFFQTLMQNRQSATQKRIVNSMSASAEERYVDFLKTYPTFAQRFPQHMIASYLGITPESLSRVRKQLVKK